jgi:hypothetical protein
MPKFRYGGLPGAACVALLTLAACSREGQDEMSWAQAALERNTNIEVVGADQQSHTITVRLKDSGELRTVRVDQVVASPPAAPEPVAANSAQSKAPPQAAVPAPGAAPAEAAAAPAAGAEAMSATQSGSAPATEPSSLLPQSAPAIEAAPGRVLESGPGYTIKTAGPQTSAASGRESAVTSAPLERRREPIVCQGERLLHIDNRNLVFDGDAVNAEDGCEIYITNSHLRAGGVGILARAANVHIDNSLIEGEQGSIDASEGAQVYVASSQFKGLRRRLDNASFHDLGGNIWN